MANVPSRPMRSARRWLRFSLRSLLVFITLLCIVFGVWLERARRQHEIVKAIRVSGGYVEYEVEDAKAIPQPAPFWHAFAHGQDLLDCVDSVSVRDRELLAEVANLYGVQSLRVEDSDVCNDDLDVIVKMRGLKSLRLTGDYRGGAMSGRAFPFRTDVSLFHDPSSLSDGAIEKLVRIKSLEDIAIYGGSFTKSGLERLTALRNLREIYVDYSEMEGSAPQKEWAAAFRELPHLESLRILGDRDWLYTVGKNPSTVEDLADWAKQF